MKVFILTLYLPSPTWNTRNFCRQVHNITSRLTSSWIFSASVHGLRSCQSGRSAAINSCQSMRPSPLRSNRSATAPISIRDVSNSEIEATILVNDLIFIIIFGILYLEVFRSNWGRYFLNLLNFGFYKKTSIKQTVSFLYEK